MSGPAAPAIRVIHATTVHSPFDVRIFHKQCVTLAEAGYHVTLLQRGDHAETVKGVAIDPLPTYDSRFARMTKGVWTVVRKVHSARPAVVHIHDPELSWGAVLLKASGIKIVYDIHENLHLDIAAKQWVPGPLKRPLGIATQMFERVAAMLFDHISAATDGIARRFPVATTTVIRNSPLVAPFDAAGRPPLADREPYLIYVGGLGGGGDVKGVDLMMAVLAALPASSNVRLLLGGREPKPGFVDRLKQRTGGDRIDYVGWVDQKSLPQLYGRAIGALVLYPPMPNNIESEPVKLFESMAAGIPVIISDFPLFSGFVDQWDCGVAVDAADAQRVADIAVMWENDRRAAQAMGDNGLRAVREERSWERVAADLLGVYRRVVGPPRPES
jgi:glycosyltransferase involved in cell wall biosynthesis